MVDVRLFVFLGRGGADAAEVVRLSEANWDSTVPAGKEVDSIYGDWVLRNDRLVAVIADAIPGRNANMTVRNVGGAVIDLTVRDPQSDQLSAYYPLAARYALSGPFLGRGSSESAEPGKGNSVSLTFRGPAADKQSTAEVTYTLEDGAPWLTVITRVTNSGSQPLESEAGRRGSRRRRIRVRQGRSSGTFLGVRPTLASMLRRARQRWLLALRRGRFEGR